MREVIHCFLVVAALAGAVHGENKGRAYEEARARAVELSDVFAHSPVHLHATVILYPYGVRGRTLEGQYDLTQLSKNEYREEMRFKEFEAVTVATPRTIYIVRSETFEPLLVTEARVLIRGTQNLPEKMEVDKIDEEPEIEGPQRCFRFVVNFGKSGMANCFDAQNGALAKRSLDFGSMHQEFAYTEFVHDGDKLYPGRMRRYERGMLSEEVRVLLLEHPKSVPPGTFDPPATAFSIPNCKKFEPPQPELSHEFFESDRHVKSGGTVVVAAMLDAHGHVTKTGIQQTVDDATDQIAAQKVTALKFTSGRCDGHSISSGLRVWMRFTPQIEITRMETFPD